MILTLDYKDTVSSEPSFNIASPISMASSQTQTTTSTASGTPTIKLFSGHATVHRRCVLSDRRYENPQNPTNRLLFNANFYLTPSDGTSYDSIMGILTYFKQPGDEFSDENTEEVYDISANVRILVLSCVFLVH